MTECAFCGSDLAHYDPVYVEEMQDDERTTVGDFCNFACLHEWIETEDKLTGACCTIDP